MYPFFHVFFPLAIVIATRVDVRLKLDRLSFAIALILPDLVDKTLMWTVGTTGRDWCIAFSSWVSWEFRFYCVLANNRL